MRARIGLGLLAYEARYATVQQLFERDVRYIVPLYQRPYVWDEDHQWAPLWDDITALLQHQEGGDLSGLWSHFLGAIVVEQDKTIPGQIPRFTVIDGQQRLTTLQLIVAAAAKAVSEAGAENDAALLRELVVNNPRKASGAEQLKVWPTNANRSAFTGVMSPGGPPPGHLNDPGNHCPKVSRLMGSGVWFYAGWSRSGGKTVTVV